MTAAVYLVPYLDGDWLGYGPLDPGMDYGLLPPNEQEILANFETALGFWREHTGGKVVFGAHSGTYCRELFYGAPMIERYRALIAGGGEIAVHPHEERVRSGHFIDDLDHMRFIISWKRAQLQDAGIRPTALRIPYNGFVAGLTRIAEDNGLLVDLSGAPGFHRELWKADWRGAPASAWFLDYEEPANGAPPPGRRSRVLEVPLGGDGEGNYLYNEATPLDDLVRVWDAIAARAAREGPQMVYLLSHLHAMGDPELKERLARFLGHAAAHGGSFLTPSEAYRLHPTLVRH